MNISKSWASSRTALAVALAIGAGGAPAWAQDPAAPPPAASPPAAPPSPETRAAPQVEEIVVTAQFREQNLQKTPLAITAISADSLAARGQTNVIGVAREAPNVSLEPTPDNRGPSVQAFIRGVGQTDFNPAVSPGVGIYIDDVYYGTIAGTNFELVDLDRVEVLRGPQGTLSGQNSIGGSIKLYSRQPNGTDGGYIEGAYGRFNSVQLHGSGNFTIVPDHLFGRIAAVANHQDGYVTRYDYACTHPGTTVPGISASSKCKLGTEGGKSVDGVKAQLRWTPSDRLDVNLSGDYTHDRSEGTASVLLYAANPPAPTGATAKFNIGGVPLGTAGASAFISHSPFGDFARDTFSSSPYVNYASFCDPSPGDGTQPFCLSPASRVSGGGGSANINFKLSDHLTLKSITASRRENIFFSIDIEDTPIGGGTNTNQVTYKEFTQELRLTGDLLDEAVHFTLGGFYLRERSHYYGRQDIEPFDFIENDHIPAHTYAAFGNLDWNVTDKLELTGGLRYTKQEKTFNFGRMGVPGAKAGPNQVVGPPYIICPQANNTVVSAAVCPINGSTGFFSGDHVDYRAAIQYQWTPRFMTYASFATGFKGGGVNPRPSSIYQEFAFAPETLKSYEIGAKSDLFDRRLRLNADVFYGDYHGLQLATSVCPQNPNYPSVPYASYATPCSGLLNGGDAVIKGVEAEAQLRPITGLSIDGSVGYLDFHFKSLTVPAQSAGLTLATQVPLAPKWKWNVGAQYEAKLGDAGSLTPRLDLSHQSSFFGAAPNTAFNHVPGRTVLNAGLSFRSADDNWRLALNVLNVTNKLYYYSIVDGRSTTGAVTGQPAPPREWRVTLRRNF